jgi:hypothetical protein
MNQINFIFQLYLHFLLSNQITPFFSVPKIELTEFEEHSIKCVLNIDSHPLTSLSLNCVFKIQFLPLKVFLTSLKYPLNFKDSKFLLITNSLSCNENQIFKITIPYFIKSFNFPISIEKFPDNESISPDYLYEDDQFIIDIPSYKSNRLHGLFTIWISSLISIPLEIDAQIEQFDFDIFLFNPFFYQNSAFSSNVKIYNSL